MADVLQTLAAAPDPAVDPMGSEARKAQYRIAELLSQQGLSTEPIQHWTQGLARVAQAGFGGWDRSLLDKEERAQTAAYRKLMDQDPRLATGDAPAAPDRVAAALAGGPTPTNTRPEARPTVSANYMTGALPGTNAITSIQTPGGLRANVHKDAAPAFTGFLGDLEAAGAPIGNVGSYNPRKIAGSDRWSQHAYGNAIDIDQTGRNATAQAFQQWAQANPDKLAELERKYGMTSGRNFSNPDFGHWEWNGAQGGLTPPAQREASIGAPMPGGPTPQIVPSARPGVPSAAAVPQQAPAMPGAAQGPAGSPPVPAAAPQQPPAVPGAAAQPAAALPGVPPAPAAGTPPGQSARVPTQMTPQIANYIRQLRATNNPAAIAQAEALTQQYSKPTEYDFKVVEGKLVRTDKLGNHTVVEDSTKPTKATQDINDALKNWQKYNLPDPASADPKDKSFWRELSAKALGGGGVNVQIDQSAPNEFEKKYGGHMADRANATVEAGDKATTQMQRVSLAQKLLQGVQTGKLTEATSTVGGWLQAAGIDPSKFGIDPKLPMTAESLNSLTNELVIGKIGAGGFPANNFSDADRKFLTGAVFAMADRPEANYLKLEVARRLAEFDGEKANAWAEARGNKTSYEQFERDWRKKMQSQDIFGDLIEQSKAFGAQPSQQGGPVDQTKMREGIEKQLGGAQPAFNAAVEEAKRRGWKIPGLTQ